MGILKFLFGSKAKEEEEETTYEVVEQRIPWRSASMRYG